jgi:hypothetical protein
MKRILVAALVAASLPAWAILIRADREDAEYLELATKYGASVAIGPVDGEGALISPSWVLTSARIARALQGKTSVTIDGKTYKLKAVFPHPTADIALVFLGSGYRNTDLDFEPAKLYRERDEGGKTVVIVGHGANGPIGSALPREKSDRKKRAAVNTIDRIGERAFDLGIKPADQASDLQGALGAGDFGGPAFIESKDGLLVAGIASSVQGEWQTYVRVSTFVRWIEATMEEAARRDLEDLLDGSGRS